MRVKVHVSDHCLGRCKIHLLLISWCQPTLSDHRRHGGGQKSSCADHERGCSNSGGDPCEGGIASSSPNPHAVLGRESLHISDTFCRPSCHADDSTSTMES